jgi:hypothetical protein
MDTHPKFLVILDLESRTVRIEGGYVVGVFPTYENAMKAVKLGGWKMSKATPEEQPRPPGAH